MADVRPFNGVHYNRSLLRNWKDVLCPVYDIITPQQHEELYAASDWNFVRLEAGRDLPQDTVTDNKYTRAAATLEEWLRQGILENDTVSSFYIHDHYFTFGGRQFVRRGLIARVRLEEWDRMVIRPHESTLTEPKTDRLSLLWAVQANTSSILALYEDGERDVAQTLARAAESEPAFDLKMVGGEGHRVWMVSDVGAIQSVSSHMAGRSLYIADGHHRYESALSYRRQRRAVSPSEGDEPFDFVMMTLVDFKDPGLLILPPHRLVRGVSKSVLDELKAKLEVFFEITEIPLGASGAWSEVDRSLKSPGGIRLVLFGLTREHVLVLRLKDATAVAPMMPYFHSELYKSLEVSIIDHVILEKLLALSPDRDKVNLGFCYNREDAVSRVLREEYQLAFLLTPIEAGVIKAIADLGDKMPRKSTYFYPKVPAGLILNRLS